VSDLKFLDEPRAGAFQPNGALSAPESLGCTLKEPVGSHLQWLIFRARADGTDLLAWLFAPAVLFPGGRRDRSTITVVAGSGTYAALADEARRGGLSLVRNPVESQHLAPVGAVANSEARLLWMTTVLHSPLPEAPPMEGRRVAALARALAGGLEALHGRGLLHLDVNPELAGLLRSQPALGGFGIDVRRSLPPGASNNRTLGRPGFSPPELWDASGRSALGPWTDVYGAAATSFFWLTGSAPPDFRQRVREPAAARRDLTQKALSRLGSGAEAERLAEGLVRGLSPQIGDRPQDMASWLSLLGLADADQPTEPAMEPAPGGPLREGRNEAPAAPAAGRASPRDIRVRPDVGPGEAPTVARRGRGSGAFAILAIGGALLAGALALIIALEPFGDLGRDEPGLSIPENLVIDLPSPSPAAPNGPTAAPAPASGTLAGIAFRNDPERLDGALGELWGSLPPGHSAEAYFRDFATGAGNCASPLRLRLRSDGRGLLIVRPAGLVWVTQWDSSQSEPWRAAVRIAAVHGETGPIDVPGLVGSSRSLELSGNALRISYLGGADSAGQESFEACPETRPQ
jgi:hypothetical protein